jgi:hypothetical protein
LAVVKAAADAGFGMPWQTVAWSGGVWDSRAVIRQTGASRTVGGVTVDVNNLTAAPLGAPVSPQEDAMYLLTVTPDSATGAEPGVYGLNGGAYFHIANLSDLTFFKTIATAQGTITYAQHLVLVAATAPAAPGVALTADQITALGTAIAAAIPAAPSAATNATAVVKQLAETLALSPIAVGGA